MCCTAQFRTVNINVYCSAVWTILKYIKTMHRRENENTCIHTPHQYHLKMREKTIENYCRKHYYLSEWCFEQQKSEQFFWCFGSISIFIPIEFSLRTSLCSVFIVYTLVRTTLHFFQLHSDCYCFWSWLKCYQMVFYMRVCCVFTAALIEVYVVTVPCNENLT